MSLEQSKINFSVVIITKNGGNTLPRLFDSIRDFLNLGGECVVMSTGSTDKTEEVCLKNGAVFHEVGEKFITTIDADLAQKINEKFLVENEAPIVQPNSKLFDFGSARNHAASLASNDFIISADDDEFLELNIQKINELIEQGYEQFEYNFVFAFVNPDQNGNINRHCRRAIEFTQSKAYDRKKMSWTGIVHENLFGEANRIFIGEDVLFLGHHQEQGKPHRGQYIVGLSYDCYFNNSDRNWHYLSREFLYTGRYNSALAGFKKHIDMDKWPSEKAQSMIYCGDICKILGKKDEATDWYIKAFHTDSGRRESLIKIAQHHLDNGNYNAAVVYATGSLQLGPSGYYADDRSFYRDVPHSIIYRAAGFLGNIGMAQHHLMECLRFEPNNTRYIEDTKYYFPYKCNTVDGWLSYEEQLFLYDLGTKYKDIAEIGSYKGRSTHALASGCKSGNVWAIDTWAGSQDPRDDTSWLYKTHDVLSEFNKNIEGFKNIKPLRMDGSEASKLFENESLDVVFLDAEHTRSAIMKDIQCWESKIKKGGILCGHDYKKGDVNGNGGWMTVIEGVNEMIGAPDYVVDTIWVKHIK